MSKKKLLPTKVSRRASVNTQHIRNHNQEICSNCVIYFLQPKVQLLEMYEHFVMLSVAVLTFLEITPNQQLIICYLAKCGWATVWVLLLCRPSSQVIYRHVKITIMWDNCSCRSHYMKDLVSGNRWVISEVFSQITFEWKKRYNLPDDNNFPRS